MTEELNPDLPILLVDDEEAFLLSAEVALSSKGYSNVECCSDSSKVMAFLESQEVAMILLDMVMPKINGIELLKLIKESYPHYPIVMLTAINDVETAVECMRFGALDYILKPVDTTRLIITIQRALEHREIMDENKRLRRLFLSEELENPASFGHIVTNNEQMKALFRYIEAASKTPMPVLITGATGTGKELFAAAVHHASGRKGQFIPVNVAGLDDHLFSDALFGHKRGAFTGADRERKGLIENAANGTLFLDEIGDLRPESQVKLLRLLQANSRYYPLGSDREKPCLARFVMATNANLEELRKDGTFRQDLYYRLKTHHIHIPALRKRLDDLPLLLDFFFARISAELGIKKPAIPAELVTLLGNYDYPGNVRELEAMVYDALSRHQSGRLSLTAFREKLNDNFNDDVLSSGDSMQSTSEPYITSESTLPKLKEMEKMLIDEALRRTNGNQTQAADLLGLSRRALNNRLNRRSED
ncbi:MAG: sigma-54-dependent transcriptional regulator [Calditrichia bacterium]